MKNIKVTLEPKCSLCSASNATIAHLLYECYCVKKLHETINWLSDRNINIGLDKKHSSSANLKISKVV